MVRLILGPGLSLLFVVYENSCFNWGITSFVALYPIFISSFAFLKSRSSVSVGNFIDRRYFSFPISEFFVFSCIISNE